MDFKTLTQKVNLHAGLQGQVLSVDATGYQEYIAEAVRSAWVDLQNQRRDWKFMWNEVEWSTDVDVSFYSNESIMSSAGNDHGVAMWRSERFFKDGDKQTEISYDTYIDYQDKFDEDENSRYYTIKEYIPAGVIIPSPGAVHTVKGEYYRTAQILTNNSDVPLLPEEFHYIIVWRALEDVAAYLGNSSIYERHSFKQDVLENKLMRSQIPSRNITKKPIYRRHINQA